MPIGEIKNVLLTPTESSGLTGFFVDQPTSGSHFDCYGIKIEGWVVNEGNKPVFVTATWRRMILGQAPVKQPRPDLAEAYPHLDEAGVSGFCMTISLLGLPPHASIVMQAGLSDGRTAGIGTLRLQRAPLHCAYQASIQPILLNSLGRSGSKWLTMLLGQHPEILALEPAKLEPRAIHYWLSVFLTIANPRSYLQILAADLSQPRYWLGDRHPIHMHDFPDDPTHQWLGRNSVEATAAFCLQQVEQFYQEAALRENKPGARRFAEKHVPNPLLSTMIMELYPEAGQIFLVRDLRDVVCSMAAFSAKIGGQGFLRSEAGLSREFIDSLRRGGQTLLEEWKSMAENAALLRYEDLIQDPLPALTAVFDYIGVASDRESVEGIVRRAGEFDLKEHQTSDGPHSSIGRWRRDLSPELQAECAEAFGDLLEEFGYPTT